MSQIFLAIFGVTAVYLSQCEGDKAKYACFFGLLAQPFWFYETYQAGQWGIFCLCFLYAASWLKGLNTHWIKWGKSNES